MQPEPPSATNPPPTAGKLNAEARAFVPTMSSVSISGYPPPFAFGAPSFGMMPGPAGGYVPPPPLAAEKRQLDPHAPPFIPKGTTAPSLVEGLSSTTPSSSSAKEKVVVCPPQFVEKGGFRPQVVREQQLTVAVSSTTPRSTEQPPAPSPQPQPPPRAVAKSYASVAKVPPQPEVVVVPVVPTTSQDKTTSTQDAAAATPTAGTKSSKSTATTKQKSVVEHHPVTPTSRTTTKPRSGGAAATTSATTKKAAATGGTVPQQQRGGGSKANRRPTPRNNTTTSSQPAGESLIQPTAAPPPPQRPNRSEVSTADSVGKRSDQQAPSPKEVAAATNESPSAVSPTRVAAKGVWGKGNSKSLFQPGQSVAGTTPPPPPTTTTSSTTKSAVAAPLKSTKQKSQTGALKKAAAAAAAKAKEEEKLQTAQKTDTIKDEPPSGAPVEEDETTAAVVGGEVTAAEEAQQETSPVGVTKEEEQQQQPVKPVEEEESSPINTTTTTEQKKVEEIVPMRKEEDNTTSETVETATQPQSQPQQTLSSVQIEDNKVVDPSETVTATTTTGEAAAAKKMEVGKLLTTERVGGLPFMPPSTLSFRDFKTGGGWQQQPLIPRVGVNSLLDQMKDGHKLHGLDNGTRVKTITPPQPPAEETLVATSFPELNSDRTASGRIHYSVEDLLSVKNHRACTLMTQELKDSPALVGVLDLHKNASMRSVDVEALYRNKSTVPSSAFSGPSPLSSDRFVMPTSLRTGGAGGGAAGIFESNEHIWSSKGGRPLSRGEGARSTSNFQSSSTENWSRGGGATQNKQPSPVPPPSGGAPVEIPELPETSWQVKQQEQKTEGDRTVKLIRRLRAQLNKMTPATCDTIYTTILNIGLETPDEWEQFVNLIFEKAITNHQYFEMYAQVCQRLGRDLKERGVFDAADGFRRMLLASCQNAFNVNLDSDFVPPEGADEEETFEAMLKYKHKMKGNLIFTGILAQSQLVAPQLVMSIAHSLLSNRRSIQLEALAAYLPTVETWARSRPKVNELYEHLLEEVKKACDDPAIDHRVRCLLKDVVEGKNSTEDKNRQNPSLRAPPSEDGFLSVSARNRLRG